MEPTGIEDDLTSDFMFHEESGHARKAFRIFVDLNKV